MRMLLDIFLYVVVILKYICIYDIFFLMKKRKAWKTVLLMIDGCIVLWGIVEIDLVNPFIPYILFIIYETIVLYKNFNGKVLFIGIWSTFVIALLDEMNRIIVEKILQYMNIDNVIVLSYMANAITLLFLLLLSMLIKHKSRGKIEKISIPYYIFFLALTVANTSIIIFLDEVLFKQSEVENKTLIYATFMGTAIGMFIEIAMVMLLAVSRNDYKEKNELNQKFLEEQKNHYKYLEERERETKLFRHDIRSHMNYITEAWREKSMMRREGILRSFMGDLKRSGSLLRYIMVL